MLEKNQNIVISPSCPFLIWKLAMKYLVIVTICWCRENYVCISTHPLCSEHVSPSSQLRLILLRKVLFQKKAISTLVEATLNRPNFSISVWTLFQAILSSSNLFIFMSAFSQAMLSWCDVFIPISAFFQTSFIWPSLFIFISLWYFPRTGLAPPFPSLYCIFQGTSRYLSVPSLHWPALPLHTFWTGYWAFVNNSCWNVMGNRMTSCGSVVWYRLHWHSGWVVHESIDFCHWNTA